MILEELRRVTRARTWPVVSGQVLNSDWSADAGETGSTTYQVRVEYQYSVSGRQYRASKAIIGPARSLEKARIKGAELCQSYRRGCELPIAYNSQRPEQSEIADHAQRRINYGMLLIGLVWMTYWTFMAYKTIAGR